MDDESYESETTRRVRGSLDREVIFERDNYECQRCHKNYEDNPEILELHHITPLSEGGDPNNPENCISVCPNCHRKIDVEEIGEEIAKNLESNTEMQAKARDHASTVEEFANDAIEITKMDILLAGILIPGISLLLQINVVEDASSLFNIVAVLGGMLWFLSIGLSLWAYFSCRTSGASQSAIEALMEQEGNDTDLPEENRTIYRRNAYKIGGSILAAVLSLCLVLLGVGISI